FVRGPTPARAQRLLRPPRPLPRRPGPARPGVQEVPHRPPGYGLLRLWHAGRGAEPAGQRPRVRREPAPDLRQPGLARRLPGRAAPRRVHRREPGELEEGPGVRLLRGTGLIDRFARYRETINHSSGFVMSRILLLPLVAALVALPGAAQEKAGGPGKPLAPPEALKQFRLPAGLRIELVAAEPVVQSPVAIAFDPQGRLWVVEMRDYPNGPAKGQPPEGKIRVLEDRDGDGSYEHGTTFADNLLFANGLLLWKDGAIVTAAPSIAHLRDTDRDGKADTREVLYEGFAALNPQLRVSHPILGPDGWVYVANGLRGGMVKRAGRDGPAISLSGMDFRFDLLRDRGEAISGMGQFGNTFDAWGRRFVCDNRHHLRHVVLEDRYVK